MIKYKIIFCKAETGVLLNKDGTKWLKGSGLAMFEPEFNNIKEALKLKDKLLENILLVK